MTVYRFVAARTVRQRYLLLVAAGFIGCTPPLVRLARTNSAPNTVELLVRDGARVNARLAPALEFPDGSVVRLAADRVDAAGDYFVGAPHAEVSAISGTPVVLRVSICVADEKLCRSVEEHIAVP